MDEQTSVALTRLALALRALSKSTQRALHHGMHEGAGGMLLKNYDALRAKAGELIPDDYYISEVFALEIDADSNDERILAQLDLAVNQLLTYVESLLKEERRGSRSFRGSGDWRDLGRELQDYIVSSTRDSLRRAMSNIEVDIDLDLDDDDDETGDVYDRIRHRRDHLHPPEPPLPPEPPEPPLPPKPPETDII